MSERIKTREVLREVLPLVPIVIGAGALSALPKEWGVILMHHRELTHQSVKLHPNLRRAISFLTRIYSPHPPAWPGVHEVHHKIPDATLAPSLRISDAINYIEANRDKVPGIKIPQYYPHLDPYVDAFSLEDVEKMGEHARNLLRDRVGGVYEPPSNYSVKDLHTILNPTEPQWYYKPLPKHVKEYTKEDIEDALLGDPHSPARIPPPEKNGVRGVFKRNVELYSRLSHLLRDRKDLLPDYLKNIEGIESKNRNAKDFALAIAIPSVIALVARGKYSRPEDYMRAVATGAAIFGVEIGAQLLGGNLTNAFGHAGDQESTSIAEAALSSEYKIAVNADGTLSTDAVRGGWMGRLMSILSFDETGGQYRHHFDPWRIAYTVREGLMGWIEAPTGKTIEFLAQNKHFPWIEVGDNFEDFVKQGKPRPDMPNPGVLIIHRRRAEQLEREKKAAA